MTHGHEKPYFAIVAVKPSNKEVRPPAEQSRPARVCPRCTEERLAQGTLLRPTDRGARRVAEDLPQADARRRERAHPRTHRDAVGPDVREVPHPTPGQPPQLPRGHAGRPG